MPAYQGSCCTDACERGDLLQSDAEVERSLAGTPVFLITAAGTSHRIPPDDYRQPKCSGRGPLEPLVLHLQFVSVATGTEEDQDSKSY